MLRRTSIKWNDVKICVPAWPKRYQVITDTGRILQAEWTGDRWTAECIKEEPLLIIVGWADHEIHVKHYTEEGRVY